MRRLKISVVVPTRDGGPRLLECLQALGAQECGDSFEVLVVDSGSRDGSVAAVAAMPRVRLLQIEPGDFQHGRTRNLAVRETRGELVAFLTQDAVPAGPGWLDAWVRFMAAHPDVAGAFGRQEPHHGADPLEDWEVRSHFDTFSGRPHVFRAAPPGAATEAERSRLHFFSNVNSCVRREALQSLPFPAIAFGEDQAWAAAAQAAGLATAYADEPLVRHSHDYRAVELFGRRYDEARFMRSHFGYVLMPTLGEAIRTARIHTRAYREHLARVGAGSAHPGPAARAWASALGRWAGSRFDSNVLRRFASPDERRRRAR